MNFCYTPCIFLYDIYIFFNWNNYIFTTYYKILNYLYYLIFLEISVATNDVWSDMSKYLNGAISKNALHLFVHNGRHDVKKALGVLPVPNSRNDF